MGKMYDALQKMEREKHPILEEDAARTTPEEIVFDDKVATYFDPYSLASEQFRKLKNNIMRIGAEKSIRTILITSAMAGEGKSLIAINLAAAIAAEMQSRVLLVDCDLRNPSFLQWFGFEETIGLSDYLSGNAALEDLLVKTSLEKLSILPAGSPQENPAELIGSKQMKELVAELKNRYEDRYIILDSSPLLATTEPSILSKLVDGVFLVIRSDVTPRESVLQAMKALDKDKIIGVVLNNVEFKTQGMTRRYFGSDRKYYGYHYSQYGSKRKERKALFKK
jgi:protein-tyrosine kinase